MKIGLIGEAPHDTRSMQHLFEKEYSKEECEFLTLLPRIHGSLLDNQKTKRLLRLEYESQKPDLVIFIRDLDALKSDKIQIKKRKEYFADFNSVVDKKGLFLLHIWEIEALILADIEVFNSHYSVSISTQKDPMKVKEPKEFLRESCIRYTETHNSELFEKIRFEKALDCKYFSDFIVKFNKKVRK